MHDFNAFLLILKKNVVETLDTINLKDSKWHLNNILELLLIFKINFNDIIFFIDINNSL